MRGVGIGVHEEDRDRLDASLLQRLRKRRQRRDIERGYDLALASDAFRYLETQRARDQRLVAAVMQVEWIGPVAARDLQHVAEALGGDERGLGALALDQRVDDQRGAVIDEARGGRIEFYLAEAVEDADNQVFVGGRALGVDDPVVVVVIRDEVGKGAADIDGHGKGHFLKS